MLLYQTFEKTIKDLKDKRSIVMAKVAQLEKKCEDEEKLHWSKVAQLHKHNQTAFDHFKALDERINFVATKVVHLGDQLEGVNLPRTRAAEAQLLMKYFSEFLDADKPLSHFFNDPFQIQAAADVIQKLYLIIQELPPSDKFSAASTRIHNKYNEIEGHLIDDFKKAYNHGDLEGMKNILKTLSHFKGYSDCINIFIEESQAELKMDPTIFEKVPPLCEKVNQTVFEVFAHPESVMDKFMLDVYQGKLQKYLSSQLSSKADMDRYMKELHSLYGRTVNLSSLLSVANYGSGTVALDKVTKSIFNFYLDTYTNDEKMHLKNRCETILARFYESKNHQKKNIQSSGLQELRRDIQTAITSRTNINLGISIENYGGETFLAQEVAINILQEFKVALKRCQILSSKNDVSDNAAKIFEMLVQYLCVEYINYAVELGLNAIPLPEPKTEPKYYFFNVVQQANSDFHLFEKLYNDSIHPLVVGTSRMGECQQRKREVFEMMESKLDVGLDRTLTSMVGWLKYILTTEQKKSDFKPEAEEGPLQMFSTACSKVVSYLKSWINLINAGLDGKNVDNVITEFAVRFHRVLYEHLQQFQYNSIGAMMVICDINEYRKCLKNLQIGLINELFNALHALCNLLVVVPDNIKQVCLGDELAGLDKSVLTSFIQLRSDYKSAKLAQHFK
ncbi:hypothetical protein HELRODRAFT_109389 [Helobdella robusta]|uniref:Exocyst complex component 5 n=1 Tax=Helobdella robusta TaxID=6412 RepID=T1EET1_HELRO|nr:hypothetical protein HELRODRAFT_109389 [Helobdella robusta]ESO10015.1 hypothetical protein HELRODRAFT_109389 [Helobdella robusta]